MAYEAPDYYAIEELLTEEERLVRDTARRFVEESSAAHRRGLPQRHLPDGARAAYRRTRLLRFHAARRVRLRGASSVAYGLISQELERGDSVCVPSECAIEPRDVSIFAFGSEGQSRTGCRGWRAARRSAASASPNRTSARTPPACAPARSARTAASCSTA